MKYYRGTPPKDWPVWVEFITGFLSGALGILGCPGALLLFFGFVSIQTMLIVSAAAGLIFALWLIWHRVREN